MFVFFVWLCRFCLLCVGVLCVLLCFCLLDCVSMCLLAVCNCVSFVGVVSFVVVFLCL